MLVQHPAKGIRSILYPPIGMMDLRADLPEFYGAFEGLDHQLAGQAIVQFPAHQPFGKQIQLSG